MNVEHLRRAARLGDDTALRPERFGALAYDFDTRRLSFVRRRSQARGALNEEFERGLDAPICLTWELTYACNLACVHCLSRSGRRDPRELTTAECKAVIDELERMQVFYVNIGGGEPTVRQDFWELRRLRDRAQRRREVLHQRLPHHRRARALAGGQRLRRRADLARRRDRRGQRRRPRAGLLRHRDRGDGAPARGRASRTSSSRWSCTRENVGQLDAFKAIADRYGAQLRLTRLRPSGRGADVWDELHPTPPSSASSTTGCSPTARSVLTGDSFFHLAPLRRARCPASTCAAPGGSCA